MIAVSHTKEKMPRVGSAIPRAMTTLSPIDEASSQTRLTTVLPSARVFQSSTVSGPLPGRGQQGEQGKVPQIKEQGHGRFPSG